MKIAILATVVIACGVMGVWISVGAVASEGQAAPAADGGVVGDPPNAEEAPREIAVWLCPVDEPGEALEFYGRVLDEGGRPLAKASVIAYGTDETGRYVRGGADAGRNPRLRGVAVTDAGGWYRFRTIKPGAYPESDDPAHIHMHIDAAVHRHMYRSFWFEGDPRVTASKRRSLDRETVIVPLDKRDDGVWTFRHDIRLLGG